MVGLLLAALLAGCRSGGATPAATPPETGGPVAGPAAGPGGDSSSRSDESPDSAWPSFPGLYWTPELMVESRGEALYVLAGLPCDDVFDLLSSGEWRLTDRLVPGGETAALFPMLGRMELGDRAILLKGRNVGAASSGAGEAPEQAGLPGCRVNIEPVTLQQVEAHGAQEAKGESVAYPLPTGCASLSGAITVEMFYEGPGDFRAVAVFQVPDSVGEHPLSAEGLGLTAFRSQASAMDVFAQAYTGSDLAEPGGEYAPMDETPGSVVIDSLDPLVGVVTLENLMGPDGEVQSLEAGFRCDYVAR